MRERRNGDTGLLVVIRLNNYPFFLNFLCLAPPPHQTKYLGNYLGNKLSTRHARHGSYCVINTSVRRGRRAKHSGASLFFQSTSLLSGTNWVGKLGRPGDGHIVPRLSGLSMRRQYLEPVYSSVCRQSYTPFPIRYQVSGTWPCRPDPGNFEIRGLVHLYYVCGPSLPSCFRANSTTEPSPFINCYSSRSLLARFQFTFSLFW